MPFKSAAQRRYLHMKHPKIAARWEEEMKKKKKNTKKSMKDHARKAAQYGMGYK